MSRMLARGASNGAPRIPKVQTLWGAKDDSALARLVAENTFKAHAFGAACKRVQRSVGAHRDHKHSSVTPSLLSRLDTLRIMNRSCALSRAGGFHALFRDSVLTQLLTKLRGTPGADAQHSGAFTFIDCQHGAVRTPMSKSLQRSWGVDAMMHYMRRVNADARRTGDGTQSHVSFFSPLVNALRDAQYSHPDHDVNWSQRQSAFVNELDVPSVAETRRLAQEYLQGAPMRTERPVFPLHLNSEHSADNNNTTSDASTQAPIESMRELIRYYPGHMHFVLPFLRRHDRALVFDPHAQNIVDLLDQITRGQGRPEYARRNRTSACDPSTRIDAYCGSPGREKLYKSDRQTLLHTMSRVQTTPHAMIYADLGEYDSFNTIHATMNEWAQETLPALVQQFPHATVLVSFPIWGKSYPDEFMGQLMRLGYTQAVHSHFFVSPQCQKFTLANEMSRLEKSDELWNALPTNVQLDMNEPFGVGVVVLNPPSGFENTLEALQLHMSEVLHKDSEYYAEHYARTSNPPTEEQIKRLKQSDAYRHEMNEEQRRDALRALAKPFPIRMTGAQPVFLDDPQMPESRIDCGPENDSEAESDVDDSDDDDPFLVRGAHRSPEEQALRRARKLVDPRHSNEDNIKRVLAKIEREVHAQIDAEVKEQEEEDEETAAMNAAIAAELAAEEKSASERAATTTTSKLAQPDDYDLSDSSDSESESDSESDSEVDQQQEAFKLQQIASSADSGLTPSQLAEKASIAKDVANSVAAIDESNEEELDLQEYNSAMEETEQSRMERRSANRSEYMRQLAGVDLENSLIDILNSGQNRDRPPVAFMTEQDSERVNDELAMDPTHISIGLDDLREGKVTRRQREEERIEELARARHRATFGAYYNALHDREKRMETRDSFLDAPGAEHSVSAQIDYVLQQSAREQAEATRQYNRETKEKPELSAHAQNPFVAVRPKSIRDYEWQCKIDPLYAERFAKGEIDKRLGSVINTIEQEKQRREKHELLKRSFAPLLDVKPDAPASSSTGGDDTVLASQQQ